MLFTFSLLLHLLAIFEDAELLELLQKRHGRDVLSSLLPEGKKACDRGFRRIHSSLAEGKKGSMI